MILSLDGDYGVVESVVVVDDADQRMYNLTVDEAHTFFVGDGDWLVHNVNCPILLNGRTLLVGEGDFSFTVGNIRRLNTNQADWTDQIQITSTIYESFNDLQPPQLARIGQNMNVLRQADVRVLDSVDATNLRSTFTDETFDTIIFNFPHTGGNTATNQELIRGFFRSSNDVLAPNGIIQVAHSSSSHYNRWAIRRIANPWFNEVNFARLEPLNNYLYYFPGYAHITTTAFASETSIPGAIVRTFER